MFFLCSPTSGNGQGLCEGTSKGQAQPQTAFIPISADGTALQLELPAAREIQTAAFAARRKLLPLQANLDTLVVFSSS